MKTSISYLLTINNYEKTDDELMNYIKNLTKSLKYAVFQREVGEKKATEHIQLYIEFTRGTEFSYIKKWFSTAHIERRKGSREQARDYCMKEDTRKEGHQPIEIGDWISDQQGKRTDIIIVLDMLENGATLEEIRQQYTSTYFRYMNKLKQYQQELLVEENKNKFRNLNVNYVFGITGVGKTRSIMEHFGYDNVYRITDYKNPWELYNSQRIVMFEEFRSSLPIEQMLNYLDGYPLQLPARYSNKYACFTEIFIVSNWRFAQQYQFVQQDYPETYEAFKRRINGIFNICDDKSLAFFNAYLKKTDDVFHAAMHGELAAIDKLIIN